MSPSLFATVQSPSQENNEEHFWSLEDRAALFPAIISEDSPWKQEERKLDPEAEIKTQEALNHYFNHHHQITSPLTETSSSSGIPVKPLPRQSSPFLRGCPKKWRHFWPNIAKAARAPPI
ncbi:Protein aurora borealis [Caligus rogercresseyi]|uniref:Protein aurora borealis n=1 Tax=Caligus rogercresseyi TaxID=217165 RepID=A0A7T8QUX7_CALRO|nr:Protein aurora borealis [Caligus rogercresseyi]